MTKLYLTAILEYDGDTMHGNDPESLDWFVNDILFNDGDLILHSNEIGDEIGSLRILTFEEVKDE